MRELRASSTFKRDLKALSRQRKRSVDVLNLVVDALRRGDSLEIRDRDHALKGTWAPARECHVEPDLLLVYERDADELRLIRVGSHAELFGR